MSEETKEVIPIKVDYKCDFCADGYMRQALLPPITQVPLAERNARIRSNTFLHKCNSCGHEEQLDNAYPCIRYKEKTT